MLTKLPFALRHESIKGASGIASKAPERAIRSTHAGRAAKLNRNSIRQIFSKEQLKQFQTNLKNQAKGVAPPIPMKKPSYRRPKNLRAAMESTGVRSDVIDIDTLVPFLKTSVYLRWHGVMALSWESLINPVWSILSRWIVRRYAPLVPRDAIEVLDQHVPVAVAAVADALENHDISSLQPLLEPSLYSLLLDNYLEFTRLNNYRLAVTDIRCKRIAVKTTFRLPAFASETSSGITLFPGLNIIFSQPVSSDQLVSTRLWMSHAIGTGYHLYKEQKMASETPLYGTRITRQAMVKDAEAKARGEQGTAVAEAIAEGGGQNPFETFPIPNRMRTSAPLKRRIMNYLSIPLTSDFVSFVKYIWAMRRYGFGYLLREARVEFEVVYGCEAMHNVNVEPIVEPPITESEKIQNQEKPEQQKQMDEFNKLLKYANFEKRNAPHLIVMRGSYAIHPDAVIEANNDMFRGWRFSEFDGMKETENHVLGKLAKVTKLSVDDIDKNYPALRIFSKDLFTPLGPKKEFFEEKDRLLRVALNRLKTGSLDDPLEEMAKARREELEAARMEKAHQNYGNKDPMDIFLANTHKLHPNRAALGLPNRRAAASKPITVTDVTTASTMTSKSSPLGNIFDMAREQLKEKAEAKKSTK